MQRFFTNCFLLFYLLYAATLCYGLHTKSYTKELIPEYMPVIGIISYPFDSESSIYNDDETVEKYSYIEAAYVKFVESGGGRAVPIPFDISKEKLTSILNKINGVLLPGGAISLNNDSVPFSTIKSIISYTVNANKNGDYFPLWGTCMGFEEIVKEFGSDQNLMSKPLFDDVWKRHTLEWTREVEVFRNSRLLNLCGVNVPKSVGGHVAQYYVDNLGGEYPADEYVARGIPLCISGLLEAARNKPLAAFSHCEGISPEEWYANKALRSTFDVISTSITDDGKAMITTIEHKTAPIYGVQWHPEKNIFLNTPSNFASHSLQGVQLGLYFSNFLVNEGRISNHRFDSNKELFLSSFSTLRKFVLMREEYEDFVEIYVFGKSTEQ